MKLNKIVLGLALGLSSASLLNIAHAAPGGAGTVQFHGKILEAACSIEQDEAAQAIEMGQVATATLAANENKGASNPVFFKIKLKNCSFTDAKDEEGKPVKAKKDVTVTFTGAPGGTEGLLGMTGTAKGASIALVDPAGTLLKLNQPSSTQTLMDGDNTLSFGAYLQGDGNKDNPIVPGEFQSVANFTLDYN